MADEQSDVAFSQGRPAILLIAGFGDTSEMYSNLLKTPLANSFRLLPTDLPGFGAPALETTNLQTLACHVAEVARLEEARIIVAHSVASIVASLAAAQPDCPLRQILSLEGNLTAEDAYFSGTAADHDDPLAFRTAFLARLDDMAEDDPVIARYRQKVASADARALWDLGCDARRFSNEEVPGDVLMASADVTYFYNPENCPQASLDRIAASRMRRVVLADASHWPSVDQPELLAREIQVSLENG
ncbi:alpha/beta fold hydrolase [Labrenzia sp. VG12]|uniref:alpha/beta fold hydrolase n=1 Tax=Labrenzia sp. VG12 TaxID=2021862 RepID=UPI0012FD741A|nr:alpha/beta hydrolase [Labrenzia sp. VG12]